MAMPAAAAANAYASLARMTAGATGLAKGGKEGSGGPDFGALVKEAMNAVVDAGHKADAQTHAAVAGKADIIDVVTAVSETEVAVDAMVSVRDRVIRAYEDILRMPI